jgi:ketosteroid isomerase-like protein
MIYSYFVEKLARQTFAHVQNHNYEEVLKVLAPNVSHHFAGDHALGGTRHDRESVRRWFNRLGTVLPNLRFDVKNVWVKGPPWQTTLIAQWVATTTLANGDPYVNPGVHIISMRWGKVYALDVSEDSQAVAAGLAKQAQAGIEEATAPKIES